MNVDLACSRCQGTGLCPFSRCRSGDHPCPFCTEGRRQPEVHEWDALVADRNWLAAMLYSALRVARRLRAKRDALKAERDRLREPIDLTAVYGTIDCDWPVPRCLGVAGWLRWHDEHGWLSVCGRHVRADMDSNPDPDGRKSNCAREQLEDDGDVDAMRSVFGDG